VRQVSTEARKKQIELSVETETPCPIAGDGEMLRLLIRNVLNNALKFSRRGGYIRVQLLAGADTVTLSVEDNGVGLSAGDIARIYRQEVFTNPGTEHERGIGLGLAVCQSFVRQHGGLFQIESPGGMGTICKISLPIRQDI
jgi:signal transduction histidine kinase